MAVLDTTMLIALEKGKQSATNLYQELKGSLEAIRVPAAVWAEYLSGFPPAPRDAGRETLEVGSKFEPFTRQLADEAARLQFELHNLGHALGWHDLQIATTALHYDEPLFSSDIRFQSVPGLAVHSH